ncbi:MAG: hypothetical protein IJT59_04040 [Desulfovibrionaceae bacterium]|nr:hypothetical protein [Desulfovibrionaceae bacterium]
MQSFGPASKISVLQAEKAKILVPVRHQKYASTTGHMVQFSNLPDNGSLTSPTITTNGHSKNKNYGNG